HQIRVHARHIGHPVMGDATYGSGNLGGAVIQVAAGGTLDILDDGGTGLDANISGDGDVDVRVSSLVFSGSLSGFTGTLDLIGGDIQMVMGSADSQIDADITGSGGVIFNGTGTHTLNGNNDYAGATVVLGGTLALGNSATLTNTDISLVSTAVTLDTTGTATGGLSLGSGQTLSGTGSVLGDIEVTSGAGLAPGIMTISGSYTQASGGTMTIVASEFGVGDVAVTGAAQLDGGLHINQDSPVVLGHYYKILTADSVTGTFDHSQITGTELTLTPNTAVAVLYLDNGTDGNADIDLVRILATYEGDANGDGIVNPTDLASLTLNWLGTGQTWQGGDFNYDGTVNPTDLAAMTLNWLNSVTLVDGDSSGGGGVPEPTALALLGLGTVALMRRRR
ncbi:MAG: dockerin type I domain-containing protein, partial [Desulfobacterales bacterium]|nr:dockerin type I domain-containing protein [Desulfobacterales bacterium]